jgi:hypothetical protein
MKFANSVSLMAVTVLFAIPAFSASLPGTAGDQFCAITSGPTVCTVNEGKGDDLVELVVNMLSKSIFINSVLAGPITPTAGDPTDIITSDPIGANPFGLVPLPPFCVGATIAPGGDCYFTQSFTTGNPGDADDNTNIPNDGQSNMAFVLTFTPVAGAVPVGTNFSCSNGQGVNVGFCNVVTNGNGSFTATIESAVVNVNDVAPEPSTMLLLGMGLIALGAVAKKTLR